MYKYLSNFHSLFVHESYHYGVFLYEHLHVLSFDIAVTRSDIYISTIGLSNRFVVYLHKMIYHLLMYVSGLYNATITGSSYIASYA
jgi:hypothetical protein